MVKKFTTFLNLLTNVATDMVSSSNKLYTNLTTNLLAGNIDLPKAVRDAMQMQVEAERKKRASILESEGKFSNIQNKYCKVVVLLSCFGWLSYVLLLMLCLGSSFLGNLFLLR